MTITYSLDVANTRFCGFAKLLGRWKGSIYKILWKEFLVFIAGYTLLSVTYRFFLDSDQKRSFESVVIYFESFIELIPLSFVLGFYVSLVIGRWWEQFDAIPWPDRLCYIIATYVHGADERSRIIRRTLGRYLILMQAFTFQGVSTAVKKRFPTTHHFVAAGFMTKEERTVYENLDAPYGKWWLPAQWFCALAMRARKEGRIKDSILLNGLLEEFVKYRSACGTMFNYDWISVPLVYTQIFAYSQSAKQLLSMRIYGEYKAYRKVVTLATYSYSVALMVGRQYLDPAMAYNNHKVDLYVPFFTLLQFFFYVGWLKVAEQIVNPYGEDDDDFELNWCLNRSCQVVYLVVDHFHTKHPKLRRDVFWDELLPQLPQTKITAKTIINPQLGSAFNLEVNPADAEFLPMDTVMEEDSEANIYTSDSVKQSSGIRYRPSFLMSILNSSFGHSIRKRSMQKSGSFREGQGHINPAFAVNMERYGPAKGNSPVNSRKSSITRKSSPTHSRASSISFHPSSISRHRHKSYDVQQIENNIANGSIPECEGGGIMAAMAAAMAPVVANFEDGSATTNDVMESDAGHQKMESYMPPIPEEPSRVVSMANLDSEIAENSDCTYKQRDDVQALVAEASKVLEELNRVVATGGHRKECESKGYESCCSLGSDDSEDDYYVVDHSDNDAKENPNSVLVDMSSPIRDDNDIDSLESPRRN